MVGLEIIKMHMLKSMQKNIKPSGVICMGAVFVRIDNVGDEVILFGLQLRMQKIQLFMKFARIYPRVPRLYINGGNK